MLPETHVQGCDLGQDLGRRRQRPDGGTHTHTPPHLPATGHTCRYMVGITGSFLCFNATLHTIEFGSHAGADVPSLQVTVANSKLSLDCSFQYKLLPHYLGVLFEAFGESSRQNFVQFAQAGIKSATQQPSLKVKDFYQSRPLVSSLLKTAVADKLAPYGAEVTDFQLRAVSLPTTTETEILNSLAAAERQKTQYAVQLQQDIVAQSAVVEQNATASINVVNAEATQAADLMLGAARAQATSLTATSKSTVYAILAEQLNFTSADTLKYIHHTTVDAASTDTMLIDAQPVSLVG